MTDAWRRLKRDLTHPMKFPGNGRTETILNRLASSRATTRDEEGHRLSHIHPWLYPPASFLLGVIGWWHYHVTRSACKEGSRLCWQRDHWRNGELGPLARELDRQMSEDEGDDDD